MKNNNPNNTLYEYLKTRNHYSKYDLGELCKDCVDVDKMFNHSIYVWLKRERTPVKHLIYFDKNKKERHKWFLALRLAARLNGGE